MPKRPTISPFLLPSNNAFSFARYHNNINLLVSFKNYKKNNNLGTYGLSYTTCVYGLKMS